MIDNPNAVVKFESIDEDDDHMTMEDYTECVKCGGFIDYDGFGVYATSTEKSNHYTRPSLLGKEDVPSWATHIVWYNR